MLSDLTALAADYEPRLRDELRQLVDISSPSGDVEGAERVLELCQAWLPLGATVGRVPCSTDSCAPDMIATVSGSGTRRVLLLGHVDTVFSHAQHQVFRDDGERLYGSGTSDMKGGVVVSLAVLRALTGTPESFAELSLLLVCDEEWRLVPLRHQERFAHYDACLCFEAGERTPDGEEGVIVIRKGAGTLRVRADGRASHSGAAPQKGRNALLGLAHAAISVAALNDPDGPGNLTVVPTVVQSGAAFNVVPAEGELVFDLRSHDTDDFHRVMETLRSEVEDVTLTPRMERVWPAMDSAAATAQVLARASDLLGRPIIARGRGGASDASHFAPLIPVTIDGLGPRGGGAHTPDEFVLADSLRERTAVALAVAEAVLSR
jgi:glutamate carboxypeptidase